MYFLVSIHPLQFSESQRLKLVNEFVILVLITCNQP